MTPPVFAHGHLRLYLLSLLSESEHGMHGYELIQALGDRFGGTYVPSAGTIYPRLGKLEAERLVTKTTDGRKTVYEITDAGRAELAARASELDDIETGVTDSVRRLADEVRSSVNDAMRSLRAELAAAAREVKEQPVTRLYESGPEPQSRVHLQEAEAMLAEFRAAVRTELRTRAARNGLTADTVATLREGLNAVRSRL
ncbi:DNA-binding PadR family transcriptional regulator [Microbacteriaceae bacterium SG_E_30_P1]|uniref:DNA-binding PadR family transcriptional regulator n=1 Tax=Antiquaquibacter oligotrophicus TaxID=2880260 RepID=A0ABT6KRD5_9MICO|nr:PadR family transcriptional regulator [Antiquaquibacter oligotrophicus]MDH6182538.1 DNA-binding PadR family transcriptional regulator [Antiquaquibacter oligotrophicus]UDF14493.1 PadR family transcriptional regulator [Antiquaquibacter oligotrophicus]